MATKTLQLIVTFQIDEEDENYFYKDLANDNLIRPLEMWDKMLTATQLLEEEKDDNSSPQP
jgi:hypothetical protein